MRHHRLQQRRRDLKRRICIDFQKPGFELSIHYEIQPEKFKPIFLRLFPNETIGRLRDLFGNILHLSDQASDLKFLQRKSFPKVIFQLMVTQFIPFFKSAILLPLNLNRVVCEMNHRV